MLQGVGDMAAITTQLGSGPLDQKLIELYLFSFELTTEVETQEALAYIAGVQRAKKSAKKSEQTTLKVTTQYIDWAQLGFFLGEFDKLVAAQTIPVLKRATVPSTAPYEVAEAAITTANTGSLYVYVNEPGPWGMPRTLPRATTPATPTAGQVGVDTSNHKFIFHAAQAGAPITYTVPQPLTNVRAYGGPGTATKYGEIQFFCTVIEPQSQYGLKLWLPSLSLKSAPSLSFAGDTPQLEAEFSCNVPSGWELPYQILNLNTGS